MKKEVEEKSINNKVTKIDPDKGLVSKEEPKKLSYEELGKICSEIQMQAQKLYQENHHLKTQLNNQSLIVRTNYLFEVLKNEKYFTPDFCYKCAAEIMESLYPTDEEEDEIIGNVTKRELVEQK